MPNRRNKKKGKENVPTPSTPVVHKVPTPHSSPLEARQLNTSDLSNEPSSPRDAKRDPISDEPRVEEIEADIKPPKLPHDEPALDIHEVPRVSPKAGDAAEPERFSDMESMLKEPSTYSIGYNFGYVNVKRKLSHRQLLILLKDKNVVSIEKAIPQKGDNTEIRNLKPIFTGEIGLQPPSKPSEENVDGLQKYEVLFHRMPFMRRAEMIGFCEYTVDILKPVINQYIMKKCMQLVERAHQLNQLHEKMRQSFSTKIPRGDKSQDDIPPLESQAGLTESDEDEED